jgi:cell division control protein 24
MADSFVMIGRSEDAMKKWADKVMELATLERRKQEEARVARGGRHSTSSSAQGHYSQQSTFAPPTPATEAPSFNFPPPMPNGAHPYSSAYSASGHLDDDDDAGLRSGRTTPSIGMSTPYMAANPNTGRRVQSQQAAPAPADRAELRARAMTEDQYGPSMTQWRSQQPPPMPRLASNASASSEASFGQGSGTRGGLRMNTSRLDMAEEMDEEDEDEPAPQRFASARGMARAPSHAVASSSVPYPAPSLRNRSASSPNVHQAQTLPRQQNPAPPVPNMSGSWAPEHPSYNPAERSNHGSGSSTTLVGGTAYFAKRMSAGNRSSGGSQTTETSETTSSQSPATPYGMMAGEIRGATPVSRQNSGDGTVLLRVKAGEVCPFLSKSKRVTLICRTHSSCLSRRMSTMRHYTKKCSKRSA